jgi:flagellar biosynthesis GTPase FlhF
MGEALRAVRESLGADALITDTKNVSKDLGGGIEITALADGPAAELDDSAELEMTKPVKVSSDPMKELRQELAALNSMLGWLAPGLHHQDQIVQNLIAHGLGAELIAKLTETMKQIDGGDERERWYRAIARLIVTGGEIAAGRDRLAFFGPTGVGKTLNLIKLTIAELQGQARSVGWIGMDQRCLAGADPLAAYAGILGVRYERAADRKALKESLESLSDCDLVLIDTPGVNPRDPRSVKELAKLFHGLADVRRTLVLSAVTNGSDLADWAARFAPVGAQSLFFTKLDECRCFGPVFHAALSAALPVSYLSLGQNLTGDLAAARPQVFASLLLTGVETDD